jgi:GMP synthase-like glutamine amidotransferase
MNVLIIDNNIERTCWGAPDLKVFALAAPGAVVHVRRAPEGDLPASPKGYDRIIVSGSKTRVDDHSPWVMKLLDFIRQVVNDGKPFLGVCYGHQMLARALTEQESVGAADVGEVGWTKISVTAPSKLFGGLPEEFHSFSSHFDEVKKLPDGFRKIAESEACGIQAMQLGEKPVFGIQFHPERNVEQGEARFQSAKKEKTDPRFILNAGKGAKLFDPKVGERIFGNFLAGV